MSERELTKGMTKEQIMDYLEDWAIDNEYHTERMRGNKWVREDNFRIWKEQNPEWYQEWLDSLSK